MGILLPAVVSLIILSDRSQYLILRYFTPCDRTLNISSYVSDFLFNVIFLLVVIRLIQKFVGIKQYSVFLSNLGHDKLTGFSLAPF